MAFISILNNKKQTIHTHFITSPAVLMLQPSKGEYWFFLSSPFILSSIGYMSGSVPVITFILIIAYPNVEKSVCLSTCALHRCSARGSPHSEHESAEGE